MRCYHWLLLSAVCLLASPLAFSEGGFAEDSQAMLTQQRLDFLLARKALAAGDLKTYWRLLDELEAYPLVGYLHYDYLRTRLSATSDREIEQFLQRYADSPISAQLRSAWLYTLAREHRWDLFLREYRPSADTALRCYALQARLGLHPRSVTKDWLDQVQALWLVGRSQPQECDAVFKAWRGARLTPQLVWQRIRLAMEKGELTLAGRLAKDLNAEDQVWVARWQRMYKNPRERLQDPTYQADVPHAYEIICHGIKRLARNDAGSAAAAWQGLKGNYTFSAEQIGVTTREIAIDAALQGLPQALSWLTAVEPAYVDDRVRQWRVRAALASQNWPAVLHWIEALDGDERDKEQWRYWRARALEQPPLAEQPQAGPPQPDPKAQARQIYAELAKERSYYGFLAADRLEQPYSFNAHPIVADAKALNTLGAQPGIIRTYDLYLLGFTLEARREWERTLSTLDERHLQLAALLASHWGWHDRAILTSAKAKYFDDLALRFPTLFRVQVLANAKQNGLDPAWVYGVMRQESAFIVDARSSAGALGLMQLMPATGKRTARALKSRLKRTSELFDPDTNILLGSAYLKQVLTAHEGHPVLATAAYNAGPGRVAQWLPASLLPADIWVETVPFTETRNYIQQVMAYTTIYSQRLGRAVVPLKRRMPDIGLSE